MKRVELDPESRRRKIAALKVRGGPALLQDRTLTIYMFVLKILTQTPVSCLGTG